jgi:hypothetical protein
MTAASDEFQPSIGDRADERAADGNRDERVVVASDNQGRRPQGMQPRKTCPTDEGIELAKVPVE